MKTKLLLITALFISTITFSQTSKKGFDYYQSSSASSKKMNKGELTDAMTKNANLSKADAGKALNDFKSSKTGNKRRTKGFGATDIAEIDLNAKNSKKHYGKMGNHPNITQHNWINNPSRAGSLKQEIGQTNSRKVRFRPIDGKNELGQSNDLILRKRPGRTKYKKSKGTTIFTPPIPTKATDYNSSRSNKSTSG